MAKIEFKGIEKYVRELEKLQNHGQGIIKQAVFDGAAIIADAVKAAVPADTGDLRDSMYTAVMRNEDGYIYTQIGFAGYDRSGTPNQLKARVLEYGTTHVAKRSFIRRAVNANKERAIAKMDATLNDRISKLTK